MHRPQIPSFKSLKLKGIAKNLFRDLKHKYKFLVLDEVTLEEKFTFRLSRMNVFVAAGTIAILSVFLTLFIIGATPLKEYIPGYQSVDQIIQVIRNEQKVDSLEYHLHAQALYLKNLKETILLGKDVNEFDTLTSNTKGVDYSNLTLTKSEEDSLLRMEWEQKGKYDLVYYPDKISNQGISSLIFFTPLKGKVVNGFRARSAHYGVDVIGKKDAAVNAVLDGTVLFSSWTYETGYIIALQHRSNVISIYKHNSALLFREGEIVSAGTPIAIIGNSGEITSGPHLHFELWYEGRPVNPTEFISFE